MGIAMETDIKQVMADLEQQVKDGLITRAESSAIFLKITGTMSPFNALSAERQKGILKVITSVQETGESHRLFLEDKSEAYAYPGTRGVHWGLNEFGRECIARGIWEDA